MNKNYLRKLKDNKKGDMSIPIAILVVLIIILVSYTLITLVSVKGGYEESIGQSSVVGDITVQEENLDFYFSSVAEKAVYSSYFEFLVNGDFMMNKIIFSGHEMKDSGIGTFYGFKEIHSETELSDRFSPSVKNKFIEIFEKEYSGSNEKYVSEFLDNLKNNGKEKEDGKEDFLTVTYKEGVVSFKTDVFQLDNFPESDEFCEQGLKLCVKYETNLEEEINLSRKNLNSFREIYDFKNSYLKFLEDYNNPGEEENSENILEWIKSGFEKSSVFIQENPEIANNFQLDVVPINRNFGIKLVSKRKFPIYGSSRDMEIKNIDFGFVPK